MAETEPSAPPAAPAEPTEKRAHPVARFAEWVFTLPVIALAEIGLVARLLWETVLWGLRPPYRFWLVVAMCEFIGVESMTIVGLTGTSVGAVFGLQLVEGFRRLGAENQTGSVVSIALARELAPVFSALMVSARAGSAMATEIGSMRVTNQIDALTTMSVSPVQYLIFPRVLAGLLMCPVLALLFYFVGFGGAYFVAVKVYGLDGGIFVERMRWYVDAKDLLQGLTKAAVFGVTLTIVSCRQGYFASGGAAGVGLATNRAVVQSAVAILVLDYVVTTFFV
ncbi:MAG: ABC transporter permease [Sandaracinaceae bacterium]